MTTAPRLEEMRTMLERHIATRKVSDAELMRAEYVSFIELAAEHAVQLVSPEYPKGYRDSNSDAVKGYRLRPEKWPENADTACQCQGTVGIDSPCSDPTCYLRIGAMKALDPDKGGVVQTPDGPVMVLPVCTVNDRPVAELAVLIKPVAFLVTVEHGTHELTRVFYHEGKFKVGVDTQRLGGIAVRSVDYRTQEGLRVTWDHGYEMFVPSAHCQATWKLPG